MGQLNHNYHIMRLCCFVGLISPCILALSWLASITRVVAADVTLAWDADSDPNVVGYRLHSGITSGVYTQTTEVGSALAVSVSNLVNGNTYFFVVTAYNAAAVDSAPSNEVSYTASTSTPTPPPTPTPTPGDVVKLSFPATPDLNQSQKIRADGKVNLPLIGEVTAAGKTLLSFQNELVRLYKPQLRNSEVVVTLEMGIIQVVVSGAVLKPQKLQFDRPTSVFQAIMEAGGVNEFGNLKKVRLIRTVNGRQHTQILDLRSTLRGEATQGFCIKDGDVIFVPQSLF
jgi:polysaccharide biosynthesis/export protein